MFSLSRREWLQGSAALAAAAGLNWLNPDAEAQQGTAQPNTGGANDRLNVAVIGFRGQGRGHISGYAGRNNCRVTHVCDADSNVPNEQAVAATLTAAERAQSLRPTYVQDLRRIMENRDIHVVSIATPNHWHSLAAIWALQAGKHVYVEKPVSHNVWEGRRLVEIARHHNRICQTGTQIRSSTGVREAIQFIQSGRLGRVRVARGLCYKRRPSIGRVEAPIQPPASVDYNLWCGPAPQNPIRRQRLHYDWHWIWEYGNGDLGNQGIHQMDVARWALNKNELARSIMSVGGRLGYVDDGQTPNTQIGVFDYGDSELIFEVRGLPTPNYRGAMVGNVIHCENGYVVFPSYDRAVAYNNDGTEIRRFQGPIDHFGNFIRAVRSGRRQELNADILEGHLSSALCHLANISYRLGTQQPLRNDSPYGNDREANETFGRMREHLGANNVQAASTNILVGPRLTMNPQTERFTNNEDANRMLTREYRRGFEVPTQNS